MGQLFVTDANKAHAIGVDWDQDGVWRWRLFLPERPGQSNNWAIRTYVGKQPAFAGDDLKKWISAPRTRGSKGGIADGELTLQIKLARDSEGWYLQNGKGRKERIPKAYSDWLDDPNRRFPISKVGFST